MTTSSGMLAGMNIATAEDLAARTLGFVNELPFSVPELWKRAERARVASDLAGLREHLSGVLHCGCEPTLLEPCSDARRYADGLRRTAALYGVS